MTDQEHRVPVLIVGAGGAGLSLALLLQQQGIASVLVERRGDVACIRAHAISISGRWKCFADLDWNRRSSQPGPITLVRFGKRRWPRTKKKKFDRLNSSCTLLTIWKSLPQSRPSGIAPKAGSNRFCSQKRNVADAMCATTPSSPPSRRIPRV